MIKLEFPQHGTIKFFLIFFDKAVVLLNVCLIHEESFCEETYSIHKQEMNKIQTND